MDLSPRGVRVTAGTLRAAGDVLLRHAWTEAGVAAGPATNGAQVLHLSAALCVVNDSYREADKLGIRLDGIAVTADGDFDEEWRSTGVEYSVRLDSPASAVDQAHLLEVVDMVAEIPRALRKGVTVTRVESRMGSKRNRQKRVVLAAGALPTCRGCVTTVVRAVSAAHVARSGQPSRFRHAGRRWPPA